MGRCFPLGALKVFCAARIKAGSSHHAESPPGGWPAFSAMPDRTFRDNLLLLEQAGLVRFFTASRGAAGGRCTTILMSNYFQGRGRRFRVPYAWLALDPARFRMLLGVATYADRSTGRTLAKGSTLGHRAGVGERQRKYLLKGLLASGWLRRTRTGWTIVSRTGDGEQFGYVSEADLEEFGFRFQERSASVPRSSGQPANECTPTGGRVHPQPANECTPTGGRVHPQPANECTPSSEPMSEPCQNQGQNLVMARAGETTGAGRAHTAPRVADLDFDAVIRMMTDSRHN